MDIESKKEAARKKSLGELGELFAIKELVDKQFDRIRNLNDNLMNETFADIEPRSSRHAPKVAHR